MTQGKPPTRKPSTAQKATRKATASKRAAARKGKPKPKPVKAAPDAQNVTSIARARQAKARRTIGRPLLLTPELQEELGRLLVVGNTRTTAAQFVGIHRDTLMGWLARGRAERDRIHTAVVTGEPADPLETEQIYLDLIYGVERAEAQAVAYAVGNVYQLMASKDDQVRARVSLAFLNRRGGREWADRQHTEVEVGGTGVPIQVQVHHTMEEIRTRTVDIVEVLLETGALDSIPQGQLAEGGQDDGAEADDG